MQAMGLSQTKLAAKLGLKRTVLTRMLSGNSGSVPKNWQRILDELGLELTVKPKGE